MTNKNNSDNKPVKNKKTRKIFEKVDHKKGPINNREKAMFIVIGLLIIILLAKTFLTDGVRNLTPDEEVFKTFVEYSIDEQFKGTLIDLGIISYKVVNIYLVEENVTSLLRYKDEQTGKMIETTLKGRYNARVKEMLLFVFPLKEFSITSQIAGDGEPIKSK